MYKNTTKTNALTLLVGQWNR